MQVFNMEDADGPVAATAMPSWNRPESFFPERSRPYLSPSYQLCQILYATRHWWHVTGDYTMKAAGIARGEQDCTRPTQVTPGVDFVEVPQQP